uniref:Glutaredoxin-like protein n=1 Tax=Pavo cristatus TaxID=9049 RepID=A0A8C9FES4_PAVCR
EKPIRVKKNLSGLRKTIFFLRHPTALRLLPLPNPSRRAASRGQRSGAAHAEAARPARVQRGAGPSLSFCQKPCPLCDEAKEVLEPYKRRFILQEVDITLPENSVWYNKYKYDIPVFHLNGKFLMKHQVDIQKFEDQLTKHNDGNH